jgi:hypothetical protein
VSAHADAVAQSYLFLSNFTFGSSGAVTVLNATDSGDVSASINGGAASTDSYNSPSGGADFTLQTQVGPDAGMYSPGTAITGSPTGNYVGSYASVTGGDPFEGNVIAAVDNTVSLTPGGSGTAQSNTNLAATFQLSVAEGTTLSVSFDADAFLRAYLDPAFTPGSANASYRWDISVRNAAGALVFQWSPDGMAGGITGGTESADAFDLTDERGITLGGFDFTTGELSGFFSAMTNPLAAGLYSVNITHLSNADAEIVVEVPEPGALSLAALGLLGVGFASRRRKQRQ